MSSSSGRGSSPYSPSVHVARILTGIFVSGSATSSAFSPRSSLTSSPEAAEQARVPSNVVVRRMVGRGAMRCMALTTAMGVPSAGQPRRASALHRCPELRPWQPMIRSLTSALAGFPTRQSASAALMASPSGNLLQPHCVEVRDSSFGVGGDDADALPVKVCTGVIEGGRAPPMLKTTGPR